ncbi:MAG: homocysteine S-methyltransferase family protein [Pseudomonadota bacterium]
MHTHLHRNALPQLQRNDFLTDGGIETTLIFHEGFELPLFAAFTLLKSERGRQALNRYYGKYLALAEEHNTGFILESATWRASRVWGEPLGYSAQDLATANRQAIELLHGLREGFASEQPVVVSGCVGPMGDGYAPSEMLDAAQSADYHAEQIETFDTAGVDMVTAITMTHTGEALGIANACADRGLPLAISFTVELDGRLPSGQPLMDAIREVDGDACTPPAYYMINCAHPEHFMPVLQQRASAAARIYGMRCNASRMSHEELDNADTLDEGNPSELAELHAQVKDYLPNLRIFGGCCGTDDRHVGAIAHACLGGAACAAPPRTAAAGS